MAKSFKNIKQYFLILLILITATIWTVYFSEPDDNLHIYFFDVGQGDSELIQRGDWQILIDGGPDDLVLERLSEVMPIEDRKIEEIIITHPHADHISGLNEVLKRYEVGKIVLTKIEYESDTYENLINLINEKQIKTTTPAIGDIEYVFDQGKITYLWPGNEVLNYQNNTNNTSIVFRFDYRNFNCVFSGDAEIESWQKIFDNSSNFLHNVLAIKIPHHGSKTGLSNEMLKIINPKIAIISLGENNKFGFPHQEILDALEENKIEVYRTDIKKTINLSTNEENWEIK